MPSIWFQNLVALLPKKETPTPLQYRPITLLSCMAKCLEKILWERIKVMRIPLHFDQGGFVEKRGCMEQVFRLQVAQEMMQKASCKCAVAFFDLKKAYDSVPIHILMVKLKKDFGNHLPMWLLRYFHVWISNHERQLLLGDDVEPKSLRVVRGVPQGSVLAPFLFNCFINDLIGELRQLEGVRLRFPGCGGEDGNDVQFHVNCLGYADDLAQLAVTTEDGKKVEKLDEACAVCVDWEVRNGMKFAPQKCEVLPFGSRSKSNRFQVSMNGVELKMNDSFKYLGVIFKKGAIHKVLDKSKALDVVNKFAKQSWSLIQSRHGMTVKMGAYMVRSIYFPKLFFGCEIMPISVTKFNTAMGRLARAVLNGYRGDRLVSMTEYLGWESAEFIEMVRVLRFFLKMSWCRFPELSGLMGAVCTWRTRTGTYRLKWAKRMEKIAHKAAELGIVRMEDLTPLSKIMEVPEADRKKYLSSVERKITQLRPKPHVFVSYGGQYAHHGWMFVRGYFNPRDHSRRHEKQPSCYICGEEEGDNPTHLVLECQGQEGFVDSVLNEVVERFPKLQSSAKVRGWLTLPAVATLVVGKTDTDLTPKEILALGSICHRLYSKRKKLRDLRME